MYDVETEKGHFLFAKEQQQLKHLLPKGLLAEQRSATSNATDNIKHHTRPECQQLVRYNIHCKFS
jgi:hypothetical protein